MDEPRWVIVIFGEQIIGQVPQLSKASEHAHVAHQHLGHIITSLKHGSNTAILKANL
jgi:hypothetical protein